MTEEKKRHRTKREDFSEVSFDFLSEDDCVYAPFDKNFDVPFIIPEEVEESIDNTEDEKLKTPLTIKDVPVLVLDFAEYLGDEIFCFALMLYKVLSPLVAIPFGYALSFLKRAFLSVRGIRLLPSSFRNDIKKISFELTAVKKATERVEEKPFATFIRALWKYFILSFRRHTHFWKSVRNVAFPIAVIVLLFVVLPSFDNRVSALEVIYNGQVIGYVENERDFDKAKLMAQSLFKESDSLLSVPTYKAVRVTPDKLTEEISLSESIIASSDTPYIMACGVYIDGEFLCAVQNESDAKAVFDSILAPYEKKASKGTSVAFTEEISYVQSLYPEGSDSVWDSRKLKETAQEKVRVKVIKTRQRKEKVPFETVKKNSASLYKGTTKTSQKGQNGEVLITELLTYIDGKLSYTSTVSRVQTKAPVSEIILVGTKQGNIYSWYSGGSYYQGSFIWPTRGANAISSYYGYRNPSISGWGFHGGIDIVTGYGNSTGVPVVASASGTVVSVSRSYRGYGHMVLIDHGGGLRTRYAHMQSGSITVYVGQKVSMGQQIGRIGSTGNSTGPHLHFEVLLNGVKKNPLNYVKR